MGRPPSCGCQCDDGGQPPADPVDPGNVYEQFLVIVFQDEATGTPYAQYNLEEGDSNNRWVEDLAALYATEQNIGAINIVLLQPSLEADMGLLRPSDWDAEANGGDFPEQVIYFNTVSRGVTDGGASDAGDAHPIHPTTRDRNIMKHITDEIIRGDQYGGPYHCIGVFIDTSGSMVRSTIEAILAEWYWNISTSETVNSESLPGGIPNPQSYVRYIIDGDGDPNPLWSCQGGGLSLGKANGCVYESLLDTERWLLNTSSNAQSMFEDPGGCHSGGCLCKQGWPALCDVMQDDLQVPATINFNYSFIQEGCEVVECDPTGGFVSYWTTLPDASSYWPQMDNVPTLAQWKAEIAEAFAVWKAALESICSWLEVTFNSLGDETSSPDHPSNPTASYALPQNNVGDIRIGFHPFAHSYHHAHSHLYKAGDQLGGVGSIGGDIHFNSDWSWRMDGEAHPGGGEHHSIKAVAVHQIGHVLGIGGPIFSPAGDQFDPCAARYDESCNGAQMYGHTGTGVMGDWTADRKAWDFDTIWSAGIVGENTDMSGIKRIYCVDFVPEE